MAEEIEALVARALSEGEEKTREARLHYLFRLYTEASLDRRVLTTIELYGKRTWRNLLWDPRCTVLFSSYRGTSYAVNGVVEIHRIYDLFHLPRGGRREYPTAYRIWVAEVGDKTPDSRARASLSASCAHWWRHKGLRTGGPYNALSPSSMIPLARQRPGKTGRPGVKK